MANVNRINGFKPVKHINGSPYSGQSETFYKAAGTTVTHDLFVGDLVYPSGSGDANGVPGVVVATAGKGAMILGVIVGIKPQPAHLDRNNWIDGADAGYVEVCTDPSVILEAQVDDTLTYTDLFNNTNMVVTQAGSRTSGASGQQIDATVNTSATNQLKIVGFPQRDDNVIGATYNKAYVTINQHVLGNAGIAGL